MRSTDGATPALAALIAAGFTVFGVAATAHGVSPRPVVEKRIALARDLLSASRSAKSASPGTIVPEAFANGLQVLVVTRDATLQDVRATSPGAVAEVRPGVWEVRRTILVSHGATLSVGAPAVRELRLLSTPQGFASIIATNASLAFRGLADRRVLVRSWNPSAGRSDRRLRDGRATIAVRGEGRLDASHATFTRLGFYLGTFSGFALWAHGSDHGTGTVRHSRFSHNYNGAYSFGARAMRWVNNRFVDNRVYGLDPHTGSNGFLVRDNYAARNGRHGIIFSHTCHRNVIRGNVSERNGWHGIVIDDGKHGDKPSNFNTVTDNVARNNAKVGIQVDGSAHNRIVANRVIGNRQGVRVLGPAKRNVIARNAITGARDFGVILYFPARRTMVTENRISRTPTGLRSHGSSLVSVRRNLIERVVSHAVKVDESGRSEVRGVVIARNRVQGSGTSAVHVSTIRGDAVEQRDNRITWDYPLMRDIARLLQSHVGPGLWLLLFLLVVAGPVLVAAFERLPAVRRSRPGV